LAGNYTRLGTTKVARVVEYAALFPEIVGRFVFIGDDGQADLEASLQMLGLTAPASGAQEGNGEVPAPEQFLLAFVAVHAVNLGATDEDSGFVVPERQRSELVRRVRIKYSPLSVERSQTDSVEGEASVPLRHRFFYFENYQDLAKQLCDAGWLNAEQEQAVERAAKRDRLADPLKAAMLYDLKALRKALNEWSMSPSQEEWDEAELENFSTAGLHLPSVLRTHVRLALPPPEARRLVLRVRDVKVAGQYFAADTAKPRLLWKDLGGEAPIGHPHARALRALTKGPNMWATAWESAPGELSIPWPCDEVCREGSRVAVDVVLDTGEINQVGRFFVVLDDSAGAVRHGGVAEVDIVASRSGPEILPPVGELHVYISWEGNVKTPREVLRSATIAASETFVHSPAGVLSAAAFAATGSFR